MWVANSQYEGIHLCGGVLRALAVMVRLVKPDMARAAAYYQKGAIERDDQVREEKDHREGGDKDTARRHGCPPEATRR